MTTQTGRNIHRRLLACAVQAALVSGLAVAALDAGAGANAVLQLSELDGNNGFRMAGLADGDKHGAALSAAGDINGDGLDDFVVSSFGAEPAGKYSGSTYVVFGTDSAFPADLDLGSLDGDNGFRLDGVESDKSGWDVAVGGDVNGDGIDDLVIGAVGGSSNGPFSGSTYVVFGQDAGFSAVIDLAGLDGSDGFRLDGAAPYAASGASVAGVGDFNGDGFDDFVTSAPTSSDGVYVGGSTYLVFGHDGAFPATMQLSALDGGNGVRFDGAAAQEYSGYSVSAAGDVNGDGFDDFIIGAFRADWAGTDTGSSYVVFGGDEAMPATFDLGTLDGNNGVRIDGVAASDYSGKVVGSAGDFNGDGIADLAIGARDASPNGNLSGSTWVVFGHVGAFPATLGLDTLDGGNGLRIDGAAAYDQSGFAAGSAGDFNGDGIDDLVIGAPSADPNGDYSGSSYVVYGSPEPFSATFDLGLLGADDGLRIDGVAGDDKSGSAVAAAGDINGDGGDDLLIGAPAAAPNGAYSGTSYVVFGTPAAPDDVLFCDGFDGVACSPP